MIGQITLFDVSGVERALELRAQFRAGCICHDKELVELTVATHLEAVGDVGQFRHSHTADLAFETEVSREGTVCCGAESGLLISMRLKSSERPYP